MMRGRGKKLAKMSVVILFTIILIMFHPNCASATSMNLIMNGNFENNPEYYDSWGLDSSGNSPQVIWDNAIFHGISGNSVKIQCYNESTFLYNVTDIQPNQTYNFSTWLKAENVTTSEEQLGAYISIVQCDNNGKIIDSTILSSSYEGTFDWKQESWDFVTNYNATSVFILLELDGSGNVWYDDVSLMATDNSIPAAWSSLEAIPGKDKSSFIGFDVTLDGSSSIGEYSYQWRFVSKPEGSVSELYNKNLCCPNFVPDVPGDYIIGLTVSDGKDTSQERIITVRAKRMNDTSDDMSYYQMDETPFISEYYITSFVPLADGWLILNNFDKNEIIIMNGITGEVAKKYHLNAPPTKIVFDFDHNVIIATQQNAGNIAKIDVMNDTITYITTSGKASRMTMGEENIVFTLNYSSDTYSGLSISIIDLVNNVELKTVPIINDGYIFFMKYDKVYHNLFLGVAGLSPSALYKYEYDVQDKSLNNLEIDPHAGTNGQDLAISSDGEHLAFPCGGGNGAGSGYSIYDFSTSFIEHHNGYGYWNTDAYPTSADFSADNKYIVATNSSETMLFDVASHSLINIIGTKENTCAKSINYGYTSFRLVRFSRGSNLVFNQVESYYKSDNDLYLLNSGIQSVPDPVILDSVTIDNSSPIAPGDEVNITINALGGLHKEYGYLIYDGSTWSTLQAYSDNNSYTWKPMKPGKYSIVTEVKDKNSNNNYDDIMVMNYDVFQPAYEPMSNISSGAVSINTSISLSTTMPEAKIYYTIDGSIPTQQSTLYTAPIVITNAITINAIAITDDMSSIVSSYHYTIKTTPTVPPVVTPSVPSVDSGTGGAPIFIPPAGGFPIIDINSFTISGIPDSITFGDNTFDLSTSGGKGTGLVSYKVTAGDAVSISGNTVSIIKAGNATITATKAGDSANEGVTTTVIITVNKAAVKIETLPTVKGITDYGSLLSKVELTGGKANVPGKFVWTSPELIMKKTGDYEITFIPSDGNNYLTTTTYQGKAISIKVFASPEPKTILFKTVSRTITLDKTFSQNAFVDDGRKDAVVTYSSSKKNIATVDSEGKVKPHKVGTTYITARTMNGLSTSYKLVVKKVPPYVSIDKNSYTLTVGNTVTLKPFVGKEYYTTYKFTSSNQKVATVDKKGKITAKKAGKVKITIKTHNGLVITCKVKVEMK